MRKLLPLFLLFFLTPLYAGQFDQLKRSEIEKMPQAQLEELYLKDECPEGGCEASPYANKETIEKLKLTPAQLKAILQYTLQEFTTINPSLADGNLTNSQFAFVRILDCGLNKIPSETLTVFRGTSRRIPMTRGKVVTFKPYSSTSIDQDTAKRFMRPNGRLLILKTKSAKQISQLSNTPQEKEFLLPRDVSFRVENIKHEKMKVELEEPPFERVDDIEVVTLSEI